MVFTNGTFTKFNDILHAHKWIKNVFNLFNISDNENLLKRISAFDLQNYTFLNAKQAQTFLPSYLLAIKLLQI